MQVRLIVAIAAFASFAALASAAFANCCKTHCSHANPPVCTESCQCTRAGGGTPTQGSNTTKHQ
jgi:hypothetical protein